MGVLGHFLYRPDFGAKGQAEYLAFDGGLVAADAEIYAAQLHRLATSNVHGLVFTGPGTGGGLDADKLDGKHASEFLTLETDPVFIASPAFGITVTNISNWNTAFGWGNHAGLYSLLGHNHAGIYEPIGEVATHAALTTGVHGAGASTLETIVGSQAKVDAHKDLTTGVHGAGASTLETILGSQGKVDTHSALTTGVHGVGASTIASVANIATHAALSASIHGVSANGFEDKANKAAASGYASLDASVKVVQDPANATATPTQNKIPIADGVGGTLALGWIPATLTGKDADTLDTYHAASFSLSGHNHAGVYEPVIGAGTSAQYWRGDKTWQTLNQAAVAGLTTADTPQFQRIALGSAAASHMALRIAGTVTSPDHAFGIYQGALTLQPANTWAAFFGYMGGGSVVVAAGESVTVYGEYIESIIKSGTGTISTCYGLYARPQTIGTNNWGVYVENNNSYLGGNVGVKMTPTYTLDITGNLRCSTGFGCNGTTPQTAYASGGALAAYATGAFGLNSDANMSALHAMVVSIRAALVANGIMS